MATAHPPQRPPLRRRNSPNSLFENAHGFAADAPMMQRIDVGDSSEDDEIPQPIKFSALTRALLESDAPANEKSYPQEAHTRTSHDNDTPSRAPLLKIVRKTSPHTTAVRTTSGNASPRIVSINRDPMDSVKRPRTGTSSATRRTTSNDRIPLSSYVTPGPHSRSTRGATSDVESNGSENEQGRSVGRSRTQTSMRSHGASEDANDQNDLSDGDGSAARPHITTAAHDLAVRTKPSGGDGAPPPGATMRFRRLGAASFLKSAPMRRNFRRRESDEIPSPNEPSGLIVQSADREDQAFEDRAQRDDNGLSRPSSRTGANGAKVTPQSHHKLSHKSSQESLSRKRSNEHLANRVDSAQSNVHATSSRLAHRDSIEGLRANRGSAQSHRPSASQAFFKAPPQRAHDPASDQENMPPPTFKRNKESDFKVLGQTNPGVVSSKAVVMDTPVSAEQRTLPLRPALSTMSANTPQRPAPPPPTMSMLDAATRTAGASVTKSKKRRAHVVLNGKTYTQLAKVGRGGSSDVYSVMAENHKLFALKRVKLADCDEGALKGFLGEIELLKKLHNVERVIRLYDSELDESRGFLSLLMEKGEGDFSRVLHQVLDAPEPKLDTVFVRWWWREMLSCVSAVHAHDIVHSDLKPGNFLVVGGGLKLIDFGIANAIDVDNTVHVHRDNHVGTPNYMSPESIQDSNAPRPGAAKPSHPGHVMKLGKPSDVWSLGCILYQMVYGKPPFAHLPSQIARIYAITDPEHEIAFPALSRLGDVLVPPTIVNVMRKCLQRDPAARPTVDMLLDGGDPWLYPEAKASSVSQELLARIIMSVADKCARGAGPEPSEASVWAAEYLDRVDTMAEMEGLN